VKLPTFQVALRQVDAELRWRSAAPIVLTAVDDPLPEWIQICTIGSFQKGDRKFAITPAMLAEMVDNFSEGRHPVPPTELVVDYEHLSAADTDNPEAGKAAGWIKALELRDDGATLWAKVDWTDPAAVRLKAKEYKFISPEFAFNFTTPTKETIGCTLLAAAITNRPFLQGMQPVTLTARVVGDVQLVADLSYEQRRMFIERALRTRGSCTGCYCYVVSTKDDTVVYEASAPDGRGYRYYQETYAIAANGEVTFGGDAQEVVVVYEPLGAEALRHSGRADMKAITLKGIDGKDVQIDEAAIEKTPLVQQLRSELAARVPKADHEKLQTDMVALTARVDDLKAKNDAHEKAIAERDANEAVETLVAAGKASDGQRESLKELFLSNRELFTKVTAGLTARVAPGEIGHGKKPNEASVTAVQEVTTEVEKLRAADAKLTVEAAMAQVFEKNAPLYGRYVKETEQKVGKVA
jgi:phage I-like protein